MVRLSRSTFPLVWGRYGRVRLWVMAASARQRSSSHCGGYESLKETAYLMAGPANARRVKIQSSQPRLGGLP